MADTVTNSSQILQNTLNSLFENKVRLQKELDEIDIIIRGIEKVLHPTYILSVDAETTYPETDTAEKPKTKNTRIIVTEKSVRDAIIDITKNPVIDINKAESIHRLKPGYFTITDVCERIGIKTNNQKVSGILEKFVDKGMLTTLKYKNGKQYKYVPPQSEYSIPAQSSPGENNIQRSQPIPGTGKNGQTRTRDNDLEKILAKAKGQGFVVSRTGSDHIRVSTSDFKQSFICSGSTNKPFAKTEAERELKKMGMVF